MKFRVISGCLLFSGCFPYALSEYALWTLPKLQMWRTIVKKNQWKPFKLDTLQERGWERETAMFV